MQLEKSWDYISKAQLGNVLKFFNDTLDYTMYLQKYSVESDAIWIARMFMMIYSMNYSERVKLSDLALKAWDKWVLGAAAEGAGTIREVLIKELAKFWSEEVGEAFVNDFFKQGFSSDPNTIQSNPIAFLSQVAVETSVRQPYHMARYLVLLQWVHDKQRYSWYSYLDACNKVASLRTFIDT